MAVARTEYFLQNFLKNTKIELSWVRNVPPNETIFRKKSTLSTVEGEVYGNVQVDRLSFQEIRVTVTEPNNGTIIFDRTYLGEDSVQANIFIHKGIRSTRIAYNYARHSDEAEHGIHLFPKDGTD